MSYYWVNQGQTYSHQMPGGYMWSPYRESNNRFNRSWDLMRSVQPGDIVFSYADQHIKAIGIVTTPAYPFPKPTEFGKTGGNWSDVGWRVDVNYQPISRPLNPKSHIQSIAPLLPNKYSPIQKNGNGNQKIYLADISKELALELANLIDGEVLSLVRNETIFEFEEQVSQEENINKWENILESSIANNSKLFETQRATLIEARRGQGRFRRDLLTIERSCRVTGVDKKEHLIASHTKPWRVSNNEERLNPENGFMMTPNVDRLFDRGLISFESNGDLIVSSIAHKASLNKMGIATEEKVNVGNFSEGQSKFLEWHREKTLLIAIN